MVVMATFFTLCPGNVILAVGFDMVTNDQNTVLAGAALNGTLYALLGYGLSHIQASHRWTRPAYAVAAFSLWFGLLALL